MKKRKERGITLIALIITIIVMLILTGVTINVAINGGLLGKTEKVSFQTQVRQIQEGLQIRKAILLADNLGTLENITSITIDELDIDQKLKNKFAQKLVVSKESDDFVLCYNSEKVTSQEIEWLEELGIYGGQNFIQYVTSTAESSKTNDGYIGLEELAGNINQEYPKACIAYGMWNLLTSPEDTGDIFGEDTATAENPYINDIKLYVSFGEYDLEINALGEVKDLNKPSSDEENDVGIILMSEEEANDIIRISATGSTNDSTGVDLPTYAIVSYIGEETGEVRVPNVIYDSETGTKTKMITVIEENAFNPETTSLVSIIDMIEGVTEDSYKNTLTVAELYKGITGSDYTGDNGTSTAVSDKNELIIEVIETEFNVGEEHIIITNDIPHAYYDSEIYQVVPRAKVKVEKVILSSKIREIKSNAFANQDSMTELIYMDNSVKSISTSAFVGCANLLKLKFPNLTEKYLTGRSGFSTVWGAPNADSIEIYTSDGLYAN